MQRIYSGIRRFDALSEEELDPNLFEETSPTDRVEKATLSFFVRGEPYRLWGLFEWDRRLFGVDREAVEAGAVDPELAVFHFMGADKRGHDIFSRVLYGARISLSIGMLAIVVTVLAFNFLGDGLRDAADPYSGR